MSVYEKKQLEFDKNTDTNSNCNNPKNEVLWFMNYDEEI